MKLRIEKRAGKLHVLSSITKSRIARLCWNLIC